MVADIHVLVTDAAGETAFPLLYQLCNGDVFGQNQPITLHLLEVASKLNRLRGIAMELVDCAMANLRGVIPTKDLLKAFKDVDVAFLVISEPSDDTTDGFAANVSCFKSYGEALELFAKKTVKVVVIGQSSNTNAMVCSRYAPSIPVRNFSSLSRLEENRAKEKLAARLKLTTNSIQNVIIWGNTSKVYYPDASHAVVDYPNKLCREISVQEAVKNDVWLKDEFIEVLCRQSEAENWSGFATAQAAVEHMRDWFHGTPALHWVSMGLVSDGSYGVPRGIVFSFPVFIQQQQWEIVKGLRMSPFFEVKMKKAIISIVKEHELAIVICDQNWGLPMCIPKSKVAQVLETLEHEKKLATLPSMPSLLGFTRKQNK